MGRQRELVKTSYLDVDATRWAAYAWKAPCPKERRGVDVLQRSSFLGLEALQRLRVLLQQVALLHQLRAQCVHESHRIDPCNTHRVENGQVQRNRMRDCHRPGK
jgi:hypothetical protein